MTPDLPVTLAVMSHPVGEENGLDVGQEDEELEDEEEEEAPELDVRIPGLNDDIGAQLQAATSMARNTSL